MEQLMDVAWLVVALPLAAAVLIAAFGKLMPLKGAGLGIAAMTFSWLMALGIGWQTFTAAGQAPVEHAVAWAPVGDGLTIQLGTYVDGLTAMMLVLVTTVSVLVQLYSREYMHGEDRYTYFFAMLSLFTFSMLLLVVADNTLQMVVGWELVGLCSYLLIGFYWLEKPNQDAANKAFLVTKFADIGLVVGVIVLSAGVAASGAAAPFDLDTTVAAATSGVLPQATIVLGCLMIFLGAMGKSGQWPLHVWLPDAMAGPTPVSALIHAATMVTAGVFFVARLYPVFAQSAVVLATMAIVGVVTLFLAGFLAIVADDIKKVLAYSTVSQLGYMMAGLGVGGYTAGIFHLFTHGFFKALLFLGAGSLIHSVHSNNMSDMGGMRRFMPVTFVTFVVGSLALAGFPLTAGFFSKDEILVSAQRWGAQGQVTGSLVFWLGLVGAAVTTFYMARACLLIFWGEYRGGQHDVVEAALDPDLAEIAHSEDAHQAAHDAPPVRRHHGGPRESGWQILVPLVVLAVLSFPVGLMGSSLWTSVFGAGARNFETWTATPAIEEATAALGGRTGAAVPILQGAPAFHLDVFLLALAAFAAAFALAWRWYGRGRPATDPTMRMGLLTTVLLRKYYLDDIGYRGVVVPIRDRLSAAASWSSNEAIDGLVRAVGGAVRRVGATTYTTLDQKIIDGGINGAALSAGWWSKMLRRTQSGNVQRYAAALLAGTVVLVLVFAAAS